jgi:hypothetical protein
MVFMMLSWTVTFAYVSPNEHPEHYCRCSRLHPRAKADQIPSAHWTPVQVTHTNHPDAVGQFRNLRMLQGQGHLVRDVRLAAEQDLREHVAAP